MERDTGVYQELVSGIIRSMKHVNGMWPILIFTGIAVVGSFAFVSRDFALIVLPIGVVLSLANMSSMKNIPVFLKIVIAIALFCLLSLWIAFIASGGAAQFGG